jgi:small subunit ribosomal protein S18
MGFWESNLQPLIPNIRRNFMARSKRKPATGSVYFDYKDVKSLQRFVNQYGQIEVRKRTGLTEMQQRRLSRAIKRARHIALLPFVSSN